jgi:hypothetical protein
MRLAKLKFAFATTLLIALSVLGFLSWSYAGGETPFPGAKEFMGGEVPFPFVKKSDGKTAATASETCNSSLNATLNSNEKPPGLHVNGAILVFGPDDEVKIKKAVSPPLNEDVLSLELSVKGDITKPKKGMARLFSHELHGKEVTHYTQVELVTDWYGHILTCTVKVVKH